MSHKVKFWIFANIAAAMFAYCAIQVIQRDGGWFHVLFGAINFGLCWLNVKGALRA